MKPSRDISRLIEIMAALRTPVTGCPWDLEQDFRSIAPYTIEEAYEVADAIERGQFCELRDELGDLLLQVVYHARMAEEENLFGFGDVVEAITSKMIRRHPHVFGDEDARSAGLAKGMWEQMKAAERAQKADQQQPQRYLDDIPIGHAALTRALKLQIRAARAGFDWKEAEPILDKVSEEMTELKEAVKSGERDAIEDEFGDVLFSIVNYGRHLGVDAEAALRRTNEKFRTRFHAVETALRAEGRTLEDASLEEMEAHWSAAKRRQADEE